jgi:hypothetical protein
MQIPLHLLSKLLVDFIVILIPTLVHSILLAFVDQSREFITVKESRDFSTSEKSIHLLKESRAKYVTFIENESDFLALASSSFHNSS